MIAMIKIFLIFLKEKKYKRIKNKIHFLTIIKMNYKAIIIIKIKFLKIVTQDHKVHLENYKKHTNL